MSRSGNMEKSRNINGIVPLGLSLIVYECVHIFIYIYIYIVLIGALSYIQAKCIFWGQYYIIDS